MFLFLLCIYQAEISWSCQPDIKLEVYGTPEADVVFFFPHEDENLINAFLKDYAQKTPSIRLVFLRQMGQRNIWLKLGGIHFQVDPNRIYTRRGCLRTVVQKNPPMKKALRSEAVEKALSLGQFILSQLDPVKILVACHNNADGYFYDGKQGWGSVSVVRYYENQLSCKPFDGVSFGFGDEDDLFWVTQKEDFQYLSDLHYHVVLENANSATDPYLDDGSMSVYAAREGWRYFNVEAQQDLRGDHLDEEIQMIRDLFMLLGLPQEVEIHK
ncbi:MAG: hypothetical protein CR997_13990 [Acidobacteria bacterium]|nr:MAG: hypothetical protein CR997_13990 [Acidobacteriota bacterium]